MSAPTSEELTRKSCVPCEGGVPPVPPEKAREMLAAVPGWELTENAGRIRRRWVVKNFTAAIDFFNAIRDLAEAEGHHPDLHLEGYRNVTVEIWTHAIGGLSENDFILAAKINALPVALKKETAKAQT
jgi:4a-hydroxytetrahydrobiopterin dehydratase